MIGATFSQDTYREFEETKRQNIFEEVIDQMMVDNYLPEEFKDKIKELPLESKRRAIFTFIDENSHFVLNELDKLTEDVKLIDKFRTALEGLKKYIEVGKQEVKKFGEVFTPLELVEEMLDILPEEVWSNPELKWLDPASGMGNFPLIVIKRLMVGLKSWESDPNKRYKHIIENMIYICELQPRNAFMYLYLVDPHDTYDINLYCGSFLDEGFDNHMRDVWDIDKFDVVIGNPPYNNKITLSGSSTDLYDKFVIKSSILSNKVCMITPTRWFSKIDKSDFREFMINSSKLEKIVTDIDYFSDINIRGGVSYFLLSNNNKLVDFNGNLANLSRQLNDLGFILSDQANSEIILNILTKINIKEELVIDNFNSSGYFGLNTNHKNIDTHGRKCYFSSRQRKTLGLKLDDKKEYYSYVNDGIIKDRKNKIDTWKVITPKAHGFRNKESSDDAYSEIGRIFLGEPGEICTQTFVFFDFSTRLESINFIEYLKTNFVKYLISLVKVKQDVTSKIFSLVPKMDFNREWTDEMLYEYFELNEEEVKLIENSNIN